MARIRQIKPEFFIDEELAECSRDARLLFIGLWVIADREGRLENRPARIKAQVYPYDHDISIQKVVSLLQQLSGKNFIAAYTVGDRKVIQIRSFVRHQHCHVKEPSSILPSMLEEPDKNRTSPVQEPESGTSTVQEPDKPGARTGQAGRLLDNGVLSIDNGVLSIDSCSERSKNDHSERDPPDPVITIPLVNGEEYPITQGQLDEFAKLYPAVDVNQELRNYRGWALNNPKKRKTSSGIMRSINFWLADKQNKGGLFVAGTGVKTGGAASDAKWDEVRKKVGDATTNGGKHGPNAVAAKPG